MNCNQKINVVSVMLVKQPPKSKSNPLAFKGVNMGVFFKQKLTKNVVHNAVNSGHIIFIKP